MSSTMRVSQWTSSYNDQFRDSNNLIAPNPAYDPSHYTRDPGFYGTRASLASTAKADALASSRSITIPQFQHGTVGYGSAPSKQRNGTNHSFYAQPPEPASQQYSALRQTGVAALQTQRVGGGNDGGANQAATARGTTYGDKNLWTHPIIPHGETAPAPLEGQTFPLSSTSQPLYSGVNGSSGGFNSSRSLASTSSVSTGTYSGSSDGLIDRAFVDSPSEWRYDSRGVAMAKNVELRLNTDPRQKFLIPGYSGFVRGKNFLHGDTYGKTTRACLDVPLDYPTETE